MNPQSLADRLLLLAADFETMVAVLPPVGQRNIATRVKELRQAAAEVRGGVPVADVAISQGSFGQPDGSTIVGWRVSADTVRDMGISSMCLPKEIGEDLERLRGIATWWETGGKDRMAKLQAELGSAFPNNEYMRRRLWNSILPLVYAVAVPQPLPSPPGAVGEDRV